METIRWPVRDLVAPADLSWKFPISSAQVTNFRKDGYIRLAKVLNPSTIDTIQERVTTLVDDRGRAPPQILYRQAFRYCMHAWLLDDEVRKLTFSRRLSGIAADLLGVDAIRLSHDHAIFKDPGGAETPVHVDQYNVPLSSEILSVWIPLQRVDSNMGTLSFYEGSHLIEQKQKYEMEKCNQVQLEAALSGYVETALTYDVGDVSFHLGSTYHRTGMNMSNEQRKIFGIVYVADGAVVTEPRGGQRIEMLSHWSPNAKVGTPFNSDRNPVLFRR